MSKKNTRVKFQNKNKYPLPRRTVLYSHKKHLKPVPEVGKRYHCFDDGKIRFSRHFIIKVDEVLGFMEFRRKYPEQFERYTEEVKRCYWLYSTHSDKFVITHKGDNDELGVYVRTKQGGWFGAGNWWNSATLDVTGELWDELIADIDDYDYTDEEKKKFIEENTIEYE
jgi:hypothetical protein